MEKIDLRKKKLQCEFCGLWFPHNEKKLSKHIEKCKIDSNELLEYLKIIR